MNNKIDNLSPWLVDIPDAIERYEHFANLLSELKQNKPRNPNRVGAAWAEKVIQMVTKKREDDSDWFPKFSGVWNTGYKKKGE